MNKTYTISKQIGNLNFKVENVTDINFGKYLVKQKINNRNNHLKQNGNYIRKNKNDLTFKWVDTSKFDTVVDEWKAYSDFAYTSCGLNSLEREVIIIDNDSDDFGQNTLKAINDTPIVINYQRTKPNGHSQTAIYINKIHVKHAKTLKRNVVNQSTVFTPNEWRFVKTWKRFLKQEEIICSKKLNKKTLIDMNRLYISTVRLLNCNFFGDLGFTGYCQQNPFSVADGGQTKWYDEEHKYSLGALFCIALEHTIEKKFEFNRKAVIRSIFGNTSSDYIIVENKDDVEVINDGLVSFSKENSNAYKKSIDGAIFKYVATLKSYCYRNKINLTSGYAIKCLLQRKDITKDYSVKDIIEHTVNSVDYINAHFNPSLLGFSKEQRKLSLQIRKVESLRKWFDCVALKNMGLKNITIANNLGVNEKTVRRLLNKTIDDFDVEALLDNISAIKKYRDLYVFLIETVMKCKYANVDLLNEDEKVKAQLLKARVEQIHHTIVMENNNRILMTKAS